MREDPARGTRAEGSRTEGAAHDLVQALSREVSALREVLYERLPREGESRAPDAGLGWSHTRLGDSRQAIIDRALRRVRRRQGVSTTVTQHTSRVQTTHTAAEISSARRVRRRGGWLAAECPRPQHLCLSVCLSLSLSLSILLCSHLCVCVCGCVSLAPSLLLSVCVVCAPPTVATLLCP